MILQVRDIEILKFITKFGYVNSLHIQKMFKLSQVRTSQILNRLVKNEYLAKEQILAKQSHIYNLRSEGAKIINAKRIKKITLQNLKHNLLLVDVYIKIKLESPDLDILSDRELRQGKGFGYKGHIPDLEIQTEEQNGNINIAIELELSRKSVKRVKEIVSKLSFSNYVEVHYYCDNSVFNHIDKIVRFKQGFKVFNYFDLKKDIPIAKTIENMKSNNTIKLNDLEKLTQKQKKEIFLLSERVEKEEKYKQNLKRLFNSIEFKKSTFGTSYNISLEKLEELKKTIRG